MEHSCSGIIWRITAEHCKTLPQRVMLVWYFQWIHTPVPKIMQILLCLRLWKKAHDFTLVSWSYTWTFRSILHLCLFGYPWMLARCLRVSLYSTNFSRLILALMLLLKGDLFFSAWVSLNEVYFPKCSMCTWKTNNRSISQFCHLRLEETLRLLNMLWLRRSWKNVIKVVSTLPGLKGKICMDVRIIHTSSETH